MQRKNVQSRTGEKFKKDVPEIIKGCAGISIVQLFSKKLGGNYEKKAKKVICEYFSGPVVLGKDLFSDLNAIKRGAGALLNARLIPVIHDFLLAVKDVFKERGLLIPPVIVRSDGTLMSEETAEERPVETLLCGTCCKYCGSQVSCRRKKRPYCGYGRYNNRCGVYERWRTVKSFRWNPHWKLGNIRKRNVCGYIRSWRRYGSALRQAGTSVSGKLQNCSCFQFCTALS